MIWTILSNSSWVQFTSSLVQINISLLTDQVGVTTTNTLNSGQSVNNFNVTIDIGVQQTDCNGHTKKLYILLLVFYFTPLLGSSRNFQHGASFWNGVRIWRDDKYEFVKLY
ncbi:Rps18bp [Saccharomyces cerevisiae VL3]|nr:Rps18bp [Saccharomyces cerevisiae VL3]